MKFHRQNSNETSYMEQIILNYINRKVDSKIKCIFQKKRFYLNDTDDTFTHAERKHTS